MHTPSPALSTAPKQDDFLLQNHMLQSVHKQDTAAKKVFSKQRRTLFTGQALERFFAIFNFDGIEAVFHSCSIGEEVDAFPANIPPKYYVCFTTIQILFLPEKVMVDSSLVEQSSHGSRKVQTALHRHGVKKTIPGQKSLLPCRSHLFSPLFTGKMRM